MISMLHVTWAVAAVALIYFAVRVARMPRSLPFLLAYPLFVFLLVGGGVAIFVGASWIAVWLGLGKEAALAATFGTTALGLVLMWWVALRAIR
jgi:hypothetical protein